MLQALKGRTGTWVLRIFAVLLIISFGAWGINDMIIGGGLSTDVATVGGTKITAREFNERFRQEMSRLRAILGPQVDSAQARQLGIADNALNGLINRRVLALEAHDLGIIVGDDQIKQAILKETAFQNALGKFDKVVYQQALSRNGLNEQRFVQGLRGDLIQDHLTGIITAGSTPPTYLADQLYKHRNEKRIAELVVITRAASPAPPQPTDSGLREFHKKNAAIFTAPELRDVSVIYLDPVKQAEELSPSEDRLRDEYENRLSSLSVPERRLIRQILAKDEKTAQRVIERLKGGAKFADVAESETGQKGDATKLGLMTVNDLPKELAQVAFKLAENSPSEAVKTAFGYHVLLVEKIEAGKTPSFEDTRKELTKDVAREMAVDTLVRIANKLEDQLAGGARLEEAGAALDFPVAKFTGMDVSGQNGDGIQLKNLPRGAEFLETAFASETGQTSDLVETSDGGYFILRLDAIHEPKLKPFEKVRAEVARSWKINNRDEAAKKRATKILDQIKGGASLASVAKKNRLSVTVSKEFTRFEQPRGSNISPSLAAELFRKQRGGVAMARTQSGYAVAQLKDIRMAAPGADKKGMDALRDQLTTAIGNDLRTQFNTALKSRHPVSIDRGAMERLFNNTDGRR